MWESIITALLPFAIKLIGMYFESKDADKTLKKDWRDFLEKMQSRQNQSTRIRNSVDAQLDRLRRGE